MYAWNTTDMKWNILELKKGMLLTVIFGLPELLSNGCARLAMSNTTAAALSIVAVSFC